MNSRRNFLTTYTAAGIAPAFSLKNITAQETAKAKKFSMPFGPHPGMFRHHAGNNVLDQILCDIYHQ